MSSRDRKMIAVDRSRWGPDLLIISSRRYSCKFIRGSHVRVQRRDCLPIEVLLLLLLLEKQKCRALQWTAAGNRHLPFGYVIARRASGKCVQTAEYIWGSTELRTEQENTRMQRKKIRPLLLLTFDLNKSVAFFTTTSKKLQPASKAEGLPYLSGG